MSTQKTETMVHRGSESSSSTSTSTLSSLPQLSTWQKIRKFFGFTKTYNFILFIIFAGAMFGFSLARMQYLSVDKVYARSALPGEWYWYSKGHYNIGIKLHLGTVIPAAFLMVWQFVPIIRRKAMLFHRINGWIVVTLLLIGNVGALMIARRAFGGTIASQTAVGTLAILTYTGLFMAMYNIKRLQLEEHRAWMLRTMFWMGTIISMRVIMILTALIVSKIEGYYTIWTCGELGSLFEGQQGFQAAYPQCFLPGASSDSAVAVAAKFVEEKAGSQIGSALRIGAAPAMWLTLVLHTIGVEVYLRLTPLEHERLRLLSYQKQKQAGFKNPGSAGLTVDRWGDAKPWVPSKDLA